MAENNGYTISDLNPITSLKDTDLIEIDRSGTGYSISYGNLVTSLEASLGLNELGDALANLIG